MISALIFATFAAIGGILSPRVVFTTLALILGLRQTVFYMAELSYGLLEAGVSIVRIQVIGYCDCQLFILALVVQVQLHLLLYSFFLVKVDLWRHGDSICPIYSIFSSLMNSPNIRGK